MLFSKKPIPLKAGDFVVGVRGKSFQRKFSIPTLVLEIKNDSVLIVLDEESQWVNINDVELVRIANEETTD